MCSCAHMRRARARRIVGHGPARRTETLYFHTAVTFHIVTFSYCTNLSEGRHRVGHSSQGIAPLALHSARLESERRGLRAERIFGRRGDSLKIGIVCIQGGLWIVSAYPTLRHWYGLVTSNCGNLWEGTKGENLRRVEEPLWGNRSPVQNLRQASLSDLIPPIGGSTSLKKKLGRSGTDSYRAAVVRLFGRVRWGAFWGAESMGSVLIALIPSIGGTSSPKRNSTAQATIRAVWPAHVFLDLRVETRVTNLGEVESMGSALG